MPPQPNLSDYDDIHATRTEGRARLRQLTIAYFALSLLSVVASCGALSIVRQILAQTPGAEILAAAIPDLASLTPSLARPTAPLCRAGPPAHADLADDALWKAPSFAADAATYRRPDTPPATKRNAVPLWPRAIAPAAKLSAGEEIRLVDRADLPR